MRVLAARHTEACSDYLCLRDWMETLAVVYGYHIRKLTPVDSYMYLKIMYASIARFVPVTHGK